jgi:hypothetical protein
MSRAVVSKSLIAPPRRGRTAMMLAGVRPIIACASSPMARIWPVFSSRAMTVGWFSRIPRPRT